VAVNRKDGASAEKTSTFAPIAERLRRSGDPERAVEVCREGLSRFPDHLSGRVTLGWALLDLGHYDEARAELEQVLRRAPDNLAAIRGLAELHDREQLSVVMPSDTLLWGSEPAAEPDAVETTAEESAAVDEVGSVLEDFSPDPPASEPGPADDPEPEFIGSNLAPLDVGPSHAVEAISTQEAATADFDGLELMSPAQAAMEKAQVGAGPAAESTTFESAADVVGPNLFETPPIGSEFSADTDWSTSQLSGLTEDPPALEAITDATSADVEADEFTGQDDTLDLTDADPLAVLTIDTGDVEDVAEESVTVGLAEDADAPAEESALFLEDGGQEEPAEEPVALVLEDDGATSVDLTLPAEAVADGDADLMTGAAEAAAAEPPLFLDLDASAVDDLDSAVAALEAEESAAELLLENFENSESLESLENLETQEASDVLYEPEQVVEPHFEERETVAEHHPESESVEADIAAPEDELAEAFAVSAGEPEPVAVPAAENQAEDAIESPTPELVAAADEAEEPAASVLLENFEDSEDADIAAPQDEVAETFAASAGESEPAEVPAAENQAEDAIESPTPELVAAAGEAEEPAANVLLENFEDSNLESLENLETQEGSDVLHEPDQVIEPGFEERETVAEHHPEPESIGADLTASQDEAAEAWSSPVVEERDPAVEAALLKPAEEELPGGDVWEGDSGLPETTEETEELEAARDNSVLEASPEDEPETEWAESPERAAEASQEPEEVQAADPDSADVAAAADAEPDRAAGQVESEADADETTAEAARADSDAPMPVIPAPPALPELPAFQQNGSTPLWQPGPPKAAASATQAPAAARSVPLWPAKGPAVSSGSQPAESPVAATTTESSAPSRNPRGTTADRRVASLEQFLRKVQARRRSSRAQSVA